MSKSHYNNNMEGVNENLVNPDDVTNREYLGALPFVWHNLCYWATPALKSEASTFKQNDDPGRHFCRFDIYLSPVEETHFYRLERYTGTIGHFTAGPWRVEIWELGGKTPLEIVTEDAIFKNATFSEFVALLGVLAVERVESFNALSASQKERVYRRAKGWVAILPTWLHAFQLHKPQETSNIKG